MHRLGGHQHLREEVFAGFKPAPDFLQGGLIDPTDYDDGNGKVRVRAKIETASKKSLVIREIPFGTTTEGLISSIEDASRKGRIKLSR